jgi:hypothetical protein
MVATLCLSYWVISKESASARYGYQSLTASSSGAGIWTVVFAYYSLLLHFLVFMFTFRTCWSMIDITRSLKKTARNKALRDIKLSHRRRGSSTSLSSSETLTSSRDASSTLSATSSEAGDLDNEFYADGDATPVDNVVHAIVVPNYKEEVDTLRETLDVLASHPQARNTYDVSYTFFVNCLSQQSRWMHRANELDLVEGSCPRK